MLPIRLASDLHIEFEYYALPSLPEDPNTVLVLAGDVGLFKHQSLQQFVDEHAPRFREVIMIPGNHEYYGSNITYAVSKFKEKIAVHENVHLLDREIHIVDDVLFVGATLWTSLRGADPIVMMDAQNGMSDYRQIRIGSAYRRIKASEIVLEHDHAKGYIFHILKDMAPKYRKCVVITHHGPTYESVPYDFKMHPLNDAYVSNYEYEIAEFGPDLWFHGHTHSPLDYMVGKTRIVCNPKGYPAKVAGRGGPEWENYKFDPTWHIDL